MDVSGRDDPAFRVTGKESNPPAEISVSSKVIKNVLSVFLSRSWPGPPILLSHKIPGGDAGRDGALKRFCNNLIFATLQSKSDAWVQIFAG